MYFPLVFLLANKAPDFITNKNSPICVKCIHFIQPAPSDIIFGQCKLFGSKNVVSGKINHDFVSILRASDNKCGENGKYYEEKPHNNSST